MLNQLKKLCGVFALFAAAILTLAVFDACSESSDDDFFIPPSREITWTASVNGADGVTTSTEITFTFSEGVADLTLAEISLTDAAGALWTPPAGITLSLSGGGTSWTLSLTGGEIADVTDLTIGISRAGVGGDAEPLTLYKAGKYNYTAVTDGAAWEADSTTITITFGADVSLILSDITVVGDTGGVTAGALSGGGTTWTLTLGSVTAQGDVKIVISKTGVTESVKTVAVYKFVPTVYTVEQIGGAYSSVATSAVRLSFNRPIADLNIGEISLTGVTGMASGASVSVDPADAKIWNLTLAPVGKQGYITVAISKAGVNNDARPLMVYTKPALIGVVGIGGKARYDAGDNSFAGTLTAKTWPARGAGNNWQYQWQRGDSIALDAVFTDISGATLATYTPTAADLGKYLRLSLLNEANSGELCSQPTAAVADKSAVKAIADIAAYLSAQPVNTEHMPYTLILPADTSTTNIIYNISSEVVGKGRNVIIDLSEVPIISISGAINPGTTHFNYGANNSSTPVKGIILPDSLETIGNYALRGMKQIILSIPDNVTSFGSSALAAMPFLRSVILPPNLTGASVLFSSTNLTEIGVHPDYVLAFPGITACTNLRSFIVPAGAQNNTNNIVNLNTTVAPVSITFDGAGTPPVGVVVPGLPGYVEPFPKPAGADLWAKYAEGGAGTYTRIGNEWFKEQ